MKKCVSSFSIQLLLALVCVALLGPVAAAQTTPTPGQNVNIVSGPAVICPPPPGTPPALAQLCPQWQTIIGDPFLQRQNEPSLAVSTVNPLHLLAGANDYRAVDVPLPDVLPGATMAGDAWCGWFYSPDGGQSWQSTLLPGFPQDGSALGGSSPLKGYQFCSDPTVRPGPGGMFFYSGIVANRNSNQSIVFVARFLDRNNSEKGNIGKNATSIKYLDTVAVDLGTSGQFIDKTWNAVLLQPNGGTCMVQVPGETAPVEVPAMTVYVVWSRFTGSNSSKIMVTQSQNCGNPGSYATAVKVSESNSVNQGTVVAANNTPGPNFGDIHLAWRRFKTSSQPDAIVTTRCGASLKTCTKAIDITSNMPSGFSPFKAFDQPTTKTTFRTASMPALAISEDKAGKTRVHVAFAARDALDDAKILLATSNDGVNWSNLPVQTVDPGPGTSFTRGHQLMPAMTFTEGKLVIAYYFSHFDHTVGLFEQNVPFDFPFFNETRDLRGQVDLTSPYYFNLDDQYMTNRRHTIDLRMAQADVDVNNPFSPPYTFTSAMVSQYVFGRTDNPNYDPADPNVLQDLQANPPNLNLFGGGNNAFIGDYIDVAGLMFVQGSGWRANNAPSKSAAHYVVWADNRDVQPPKQRNPLNPLEGDYANFTAVGFAGPSFFDGSPRQSCQVGQAGIKDQNVYLSRITQGFLLTVPQNMKRLSPALTRSFVELAQNFTSKMRSFHLTIQAPPGVRASFVQSEVEASPPPANLTTALDVAIPANSGIARSIFVRASDSTQAAASITINAVEFNVPPGETGFSSFVVLNPGGAVTDLLPPDGGSSPDTNEVYNPTVKSPTVKSPTVKSPTVKSPTVKSPTVKSPTVKSPTVKSPTVKSTSIAEMDPTAASTTTTDPVEGDTSVSDKNVGLAAAACVTECITDASYVLTNTGNTTASYTIKLVGVSSPITNATWAIGTATVTVGNGTLFGVGGGLQITGATPASWNIACVITAVTGNDLQCSVPSDPGPWTSGGTAQVGFQLIISQTGISFTTDPNSADCSQPVPQQYNVVIATINSADLQFVNVDPDLGNPNAGGSISVLVPPGEERLITLRGGAAIDIIEDALESTAPAAVSLGANTDGSATPLGAPLFISTPALSSGIVAAPYSFTLQAIGGAQPPFTWSVIANIQGSLAALGLSLDPNSGTITGTSSTGAPTHAGSATVKFQVTDSATPDQGIAKRTLTVTVAKANTMTAITSDDPDPSVTGENVEVYFTVNVTPPSSGPVPGSVTVSADDGSAIPCTADISTGHCTLVFTTGGLKTLKANFAGDDDYEGSFGTATHAVKAESTTTITSDAPDPSVVFQPIVVNFTVAAKPPATGTPTGNVTVTDGTGASCTATVAAGTCTLTPTSPGTKTLTATYAGNTVFNGSSDTEDHFVDKITTTTTITSNIPNPAYLGQTVTVRFAVAAVPPGTGTATGMVTVSDGRGLQCTASVTAGSCTLLFTSVGDRTLTASYPGDANYKSSVSAGVQQQVLFVFAGFFSPLNTAGTCASPTSSGVQKLGNAAPVKWRLSDFNGTLITSIADAFGGNGTLEMFNGTACGTPGSGVLLYSPTLGAKGGSTMRYDVGGSMFIFNWDTSTGVTTGFKTLVLTLADGSVRVTKLQFK